MRFLSFEVRKRSYTAFVGLLLAACAGNGSNPAPAQPGPTPGAVDGGADGALPGPGPGPDGGPADGGAEDASADAATRIARADDRLARIAAGVATEDGARGGVAKTAAQKVAEQIRREREAADAAARLARGAATDANAVAFDRAVDALETVYLTSFLYSTDPAGIPGAFTPDAGRDALGTATVDAKLRAWQQAAGTKGFIKFAVVVGAGGALEMRVGKSDVGHVDIAGGAAVSAGILRVDITGSRPTVAELENTSGGFRPGPLRNRAALKAVTAAGYLPAAPASIKTYDNPTGSYATSTISPSN